MIEITCKRCGKKEQRVTVALNCLSCATKSPYKYKKKEVDLVCIECNKPFKGNHPNNRFCSKICEEIDHNSGINQHWLDRQVKKKYKAKALGDFNMQVSSNMEIME